MMDDATAEISWKILIGFDGRDWQEEVYQKKYVDFYIFLIRVNSLCYVST
jgi:hypothetical protein